MIKAWFQRLRAPQPDVPALLSQAQALQRESRLDDAARLYDDILALEPGHEEALLVSARLEGRRGRLDVARTRLHAALARNPNNARAHADLGNVLRLAGDVQDALESYETALALDPSHSVAWNNLGLIQLARGDVEGAVKAFSEALALAPGFGEALRNFASAMAKLGRYAELAARLDAILQKDGGNADAHAALGFAKLKGAGEPGAALACFERARQLGADDAELLVNRGIALHDLGRIDYAIASYDAALAKNPHYALARFHRALAHLITHRFELAWDDYESRLASEAVPVRPFGFPPWQGEDISGKTLLIYAEQGLGDEIMFASCFAETIARAGHCVIDCAAKLAPIFRRSFPQATVHGGTQFDSAEWLSGMAQPDAQIAAGSLPRILRRELAAFPSRAGYLVADPGRTQWWRERLAGLGAGLKVGVSWRGGTSKSRSGLRSLTLDRLLPVFSVPGVQFVCLQYDATEKEVAEFVTRFGVVLHHFSGAIDAYDETAALVSALDLVVSVCTAVIHLGGALGTPVWVMAPRVPEWRYGLSGEGMPWYPRNRVLRQEAPGDWEKLIARVAAELAAHRAGTGS